MKREYKWNIWRIAVWNDFRHDSDTTACLIVLTVFLAFKVLCCLIRHLCRRWNRISPLLRDWVTGCTVNRHVYNFWWHKCFQHSAGTRCCPFLPSKQHLSLWERLSYDECIINPMLYMNWTIAWFVLAFFSISNCTFRSNISFLHFWKSYIKHISESRFLTTQYNKGYFV